MDPKIKRILIAVGVIAVVGFFTITTVLSWVVWKMPAGFLPG